MNFGLPERILQAIIEKLEEKESVTRAVIFGSRTRGDYAYNSDIESCCLLRRGIARRVKAGSRRGRRYTQDRCHRYERPAG